METKDITKRLSKSKINSFKQCPKKYWFEQHYPEEFVTSEAMKRGSELHDLFENLYKENINDKEKLKEKLMQLDKEGKFKKEINLFINWQEQFNFNIPESIEEKLYDEEEDIVVMWDRIDFDGKKRILWDYKTGRLKKAEDFKFELFLYAYIYMKNTRKPVHYVGIYFIDHGKYDLIPVTKESMQEFIVELKNIRDEMRDCQNNNIWPARRNQYCNWCSYKNRCPLYKK